MANLLYVKAKEALLSAGINWTTDTIKAVLVDTANYAIDENLHNALDDIPVAARVATSVALTGKGIATGTATAANVSLPTVSGNTVEAIVVYKEGATEADSPLILYIDTADFLPLTPNGGEVLIEWGAGDGRLFKL